MIKPNKPTADKVQPRNRGKGKGGEKIVRGGGGGVTANSIGRATSVSGAQPYGRPVRRSPIVPMTSGPANMGGKADA